MKVVVITGSRNWTDRDAIARVLEGADVAILGDCPTGADRIAREICDARGTRYRVHFAEWDMRGRMAGPERNARMVANAKGNAVAGHEVTVHAFPLPDSRGTWDCVRKAKAAGLAVEVHRP